MSPRTYGEGSVYQRKSDGRWIGAFQYGWNANGKRRRIVVTAKTEAQARRKMRDKRRALDSGGRVTNSRATVKTWADAYLNRRVTELAPKAYRAAENPIRNWVIPTIGHRRLDQLGPDDIRDVHTACRKAGRAPGDVHRALHTMLQDALANGHPVSPSALAVKPPKADKSDREAMTIDEGLAALAVASTLPHGSRWVFTLLYGARLGECLGMTRDAIDWDAGAYGEARIEWQLQQLPYAHGCDGKCGKPQARSCPERRFQVPDGYEKRHLVDSFHLVRPKSKAGFRVAPFLPFVRNSLEHWLDQAPDNPWGLVWPTVDGRPANDKHDREEWHVLQETAGIHHPTRLRVDAATGELVPAFYHVHECRSFAATMLFDAEVPEHVITDLLGHSSIVTSLRYRTRRREPLVEALTRVGQRLQLG